MIGVKAKYRRLAALAPLLIFFLSACSQEGNVIGLERPVYTEEKSEIVLHFFEQRAEAERYYAATDAQEYFLFVSSWGDAEAFFHGLDGEPAGEGGKRLRFTADDDATAIAKVVELIDDSGLTRLSRGGDQRL
ncbi:MAG: hypothetical protein ACOCVK_00475 [bacterium]